MHTPAETLELVTAAAEAKASAPIKKLLILGFFAGLLIALAALTSTIASMNLLSTPETYGLGKLIQGLVFSGGLIMVVLGSTELFTGNSLMIIGVLSHRISLKRLLRNWGFVILGNLLGALFLALLAASAGIFKAGSGQLGASLISISTSKISLNIWSAFALGILCNFLVCLAVWLAFSAKTTSGKILAIIFPVTFFIACGFEHSVANFFYLPAGMLASGSFNFVGLLHNLLPVIFGNIVGGGLFISCGYFYAFKNPQKTKTPKKLKRKNNPFG